MQELNNPQQAKQYFKKSYAIYNNIFGEDSNRTKEVQSYLEQVVHKKSPDDSLNRWTIDKVSSE